MSAALFATAYAFTKRNHNYGITAQDIVSDAYYFLIDKDANMSKLERLLNKADLNNLGQLYTSVTAALESEQNAEFISTH